MTKHIWCMQHFANINLLCIVGFKSLQHLNLCSAKKCLYRPREPSDTFPNREILKTEELTLTCHLFVTSNNLCCFWRSASHFQVDGEGGFIVFFFLFFIRTRVEQILGLLTQSTNEPAVETAGWKRRHQ